MNGVFEIEIDEKTITLLFGVSGVDEFQRRSVYNPSEDSVKVFTDLLYSGLYGYAMRQGKGKPDYETAYDLMEAILGLPNSDAISANIWDTFKESVHGANFLAKIEAINKKAKEDAELIEGGEAKKKVSPKKSRNTKKEGN